MTTLIAVNWDLIEEPLSYDSLSIAISVRFVQNKLEVSWIAPKSWEQHQTTIQELHINIKKIVLQKM